MVTLAGSRKVGQSRAPLRHSSRRAASEKSVSRGPHCATAPLVRSTPGFIWGTVALRTSTRGLGDYDLRLGLRKHVRGGYRTGAALKSVQDRGPCTRGY